MTSSLLTIENETRHTDAKNVTYSVVFTLVAENVYFSCMEDPDFPDDIKTRLASDIIALWENDIDPASLRHLTALALLWTARDAAPPHFGTMDGTAELWRISLGMEADTEWDEFLKKESANYQTIWALEEFLFGLSYEEILQVRSRLKTSEVHSISNKDIYSYLNSKPVYSLVNDKSPRAIYDFFKERREACTRRKKTSAAGPFYTLEEIYLKYRIMKENGLLQKQPVTIIM